MYTLPSASSSDAFLRHHFLDQITDSKNMVFLLKNRKKQKTSASILFG
jgi:hypothetical protein